jgi:hypothetical protein
MSAHDYNDMDLKVILGMMEREGRLLMMGRERVY